MAFYTDLSTFVIKEDLLLLIVEQDRIRSGNPDSDGFVPPGRWTGLQRAQQLLEVRDHGHLQERRNKLKPKTYLTDIVRQDLAPAYDM